MKPAELPADIVQLLTAISELPDTYRRHLMFSVDAVTDAVMRRRQILALIQEALASIRLDMKYAIFDLEATRRERDAALKALGTK